MPVRTTEIASYTLEFRSTPTEHVPMLFLHDGDHALVASVAFADGVEPLPGPRETPAGHIALTLPPSSLGDLMHLLREEAPVFFRWDRDGEVASITTEEEGVGEEEARSLLAMLFG